MKLGKVASETFWDVMVSPKKNNHEKKSLEAFEETCEAAWQAVGEKLYGMGQAHTTRTYPKQGK